MGLLGYNTHNPYSWILSVKIDPMKSSVAYKIQIVVWYEISFVWILQFLFKVISGISTLVLYNRETILFVA